MFIKIYEYLQRENKLKFPYKGTVLDNIDPLKLGRIKCTIENLIIGEKESLPWIFPKFNNPYDFVIPPIGVKVEIRFSYHDIYSGFYNGRWEDSASHIADFDTDSPDTYGWVDEKLNKFLINKAKKEFLIELENLFKFKVEEDGKTSIETPGDFEIKVNEDITIKCTKDGKVEIGSKNGTSTGGADSLAILALIKKLCETLAIDTPPGYGGPMVGAATYQSLGADAGTLKTTL